MFNIFGFNKPLPNRSLEEIKNVARILFIDDRKFRLIDILKSSNWRNVSWIKDPDSVTCQEIRDAHIILVDIQGVGKKLEFHEEGLGLTIAIKDQFPEKKVIVYSSEEGGQIAAFHEGLSKADSRISKNSDPYQFERAIEKHAKELYTLDECITRLKKILQTELGHNHDYNEIEKILRNIQKNKKFDINSISNAFKITASSAVIIANILKIYFLEHKQ